MSITKRKTSRGFILVTLSIIAGALSMFLMLYLGHFQALQSVRITRSDCRSNLYKIQSQALEGLHKAIGLNPLLNSLNKTISIAVGALAISPSNPAALKILAKAKEARNRLIKTQNTLIRVTELRRQASLQKEYTKSSKLKGSVYTIQMENIRIAQASTRLPVRRLNPNDPYSLLELSPNLEEQSQISKFWNQTVKENLRDKKWNHQKYTVLGCQVSLRRLNSEEGQVVLSEDKLSSRVRFFF